MTGYRELEGAEMTATILTLPRQAPEPEPRVTPGLVLDVADAVRRGDDGRVAELCASVPCTFEGDEALRVHPVIGPGAYRGTAVTVTLSTGEDAAVTRLVRVLGLRFEDRWAPSAMPVVSDRYGAVLDGLRVQVLHFYPPS